MHALKGLARRAPFYVGLSVMHSVIVLIYCIFSYSLLHLQTLLAPGPQEAIVYSASGGTHEISVWDVSVSLLVNRIPVHSDVITSLLYSPALGMLVTTSLDKTVCLFAPSSDGHNLTPVSVLHGHCRGVEKVRQHKYI